MSIEPVGLLIFLAVMTGTPGPANMLLLGAAARYGLRRAAPFLLGVVPGMQFVIWPLGLGLLEIGERVPGAYRVLQALCAVYILWLAWRIAGSRIETGAATAPAPGFGRGLLVHPLNPKAWAIVTGAFTQFVAAGTEPLAATAALAAATLLVGIVLQGLWFWSGAGIARLLAGHPAERWSMRVLGVLTVLSVLLALR